MSGRCVLPIAADHPAFAGHFPGRPIVPGVVLLDEAVRALDAALCRGDVCWTLGSAKFLSPVTPGETVELSWQAPAASGAIAFKLACGERAVASGTLTPQPGDGGPR